MKTRRQLLALPALVSLPNNALYAATSSIPEVAEHLVRVLEAQKGGTWAVSIDHDFVLIAKTT